MKYLFLFSIGPVQSFIAQARKSRDLRLGSELLSRLIGTALDDPSIEVIFPSKNLKSKPNRFISLIEAADDAEAKVICGRVEKTVRDKYAQLVDIAIRDHGKHPLVDEHINNFLEVYWFAVPYKGDENYHSQYLEVERTFASLKNARLFNQSSEEGARKCSLCGERNAIYYGTAGSKPADVVDDAISIEQDQSLEDKEGLCGVCFSKRFFFKNQHPFPSTAEIALGDTLIKAARDTQLQKMIETYPTIGDGQLFYPDNLTEKYFQKQKIKTKEPLKKFITGLAGQLSAIRRAAAEMDLKFTEYYALVMVDADNMGKWMSGEYLKEKTKLKKFQELVSKSLGNFADKITTRLDDVKGRGKTVYAGGDDFLGFVNLNHLTPFLAEFKELFDDLVNKPILEFIGTGTQPMTYSAGIVIAHYKTPLTEVVMSVREMEKKAKKFSAEKSHFALSVMKHSGEVETTVQPWNLGPDFIPDFINHISKTITNSEFSKSFITNIEIELKKLISKDNYPPFINQLIAIEISRLLKRSCMLENVNRLSKQDFEKLKEDKIKELVDKIMMIWNQKGDITNMTSFLSISEFISRHLNGGK